jgi:hypothetical protein
MGARKQCSVCGKVTGHNARTCPERRAVPETGGAPFR